MPRRVGGAPSVGSEVTRFSNESSDAGLLCGIDAPEDTPAVLVEPTVIRVPSTGTFSAAPPLVKFVRSPFKLPVDKFSKGAAFGPPSRALAIDSTTSSSTAVQRGALHCPARSMAWSRAQHGIVQRAAWHRTADAVIACMSRRRGYACKPTILQKTCVQL